MCLKPMWTINQTFICLDASPKFTKCVNEWRNWLGSTSWVLEIHSMLIQIWKLTILFWNWWFSIANVYKIVSCVDFASNYEKKNWNEVNRHFQQVGMGK